MNLPRKRMQAFVQKHVNLDWQLPLLMVILLQLPMLMAFLWLHVIFTHLKLLAYQSSILGITANRSL